MRINFNTYGDYDAKLIKKNKYKAISQLKVITICPFINPEKAEAQCDICFIFVAMNAILILDFGSQYTQLIARRVRELNVYCEIHPFNKIPDNLSEFRGVILSGSPSSVRDKNAPVPELGNIRGEKPLLGVCYGAQYLAQSSGGSVEASETREYGRANLGFIQHEDRLVQGMSQGSQVWMSHGDTIQKLPDNFTIIASTADVEVAGFKIENEESYGIQFHPEVLSQ